MRRRIGGWSSYLPHSSATSMGLCLAGDSRIRIWPRCLRQLRSRKARHRGGRMLVHPTRRILSIAPAQFGAFGTDGLRTRPKTHPRKAAPSGQDEDQDHERQVSRHPPHRDRGHRPCGETNERDQPDRYQDGSQGTPMGVYLRTRAAVSAKSDLEPASPRAGPCIRCGRGRDQGGSALSAAR
jgi:hypothetical protein